jgi:hypothetical protein
MVWKQISFKSRGMKPHILEKRDGLVPNILRKKGDETPCE